MTPPRRPARVLQPGQSLYVRCNAALACFTNNESRPVTVIYRVCPPQIRKAPA